MIGIFNNREIAIAIWLFALFIFMLFNESIRSSMFNLVKAFFHKKILLTILLIILYFSAMLVLLYLVKFWNTALLKDSIIWLVFTGLLTCFNPVTAKQNEKVFRKIIRENLSIVLVLEFILNTYTFSLVVELILLPALTLIILFAEVSKTNSKYKSVENLMNRLQITLSFIILISIIYRILADFSNFWIVNTLKSFLLPIILTIIFLPFIYFLVLYSRYEILFLGLNLGEAKSIELKKYAKKKIFKHCFLSLAKVNKALNSSFSIDLRNIKTKKDVDELIEKGLTEEQ